MGSIRIPSQRKDDEISVLVTGFGAFRSHTTNPSWMIASSLPEVIPAKEGEKKIRLYVIPEPVKVSYTTVREQIPPLLFTSKNVEGAVPRTNFDIVLHLGVSHAIGYYEMETRAFRDNYVTPDVDGETNPKGFESWKDQGAPEMIPIGFDTHLVLTEWKKNAKKIDVRRSADAGRYLCEYILFTSLLEYHKKAPNTPAPVTFLHVPSETGPAEIQRGREAALELIKALAHHIPAKTS